MTNVAELSVVVLDNVLLQAGGRTGAEDHLLEKQNALKTLCYHGSQTFDKSL